jgi:hypothetical protein
MHTFCIVLQVYMQILNIIFLILILQFSTSTLCRYLACFCYVFYMHELHLLITIYTEVLYRVYTKEWCGFKSENYWNRTILLCIPCISLVSVSRWCSLRGKNWIFICTVDYFLLQKLIKTYYWSVLLPQLSPLYFNKLFRHEKKVLVSSAQKLWEFWSLSCLLTNRSEFTLILLTSSLRVKIFWEATGN